MKSTTSTKKETTKVPPCALWNHLEGGTRVMTVISASQQPDPFSQLTHNPASKVRDKRQVHIIPQKVIQRCKFYPWILLVQKYCSLNKDADVTAAIAIKQKNTKLISTSRIPSFLCPQNGIRRSRASINEIMTYVSGSSFFVLFWL